MTEFYKKRWDFEPGNVSRGIDLGWRATNGMTNWDREAKWKWLRNIITFSLRVHVYEIDFRFYHPGCWSLYLLELHPTRG